jgi:hypothetical protein
VLFSVDFYRITYSPPLSALNCYDRSEATRNPNPKLLGKHMGNKVIASIKQVVPLITFFDLVMFMIIIVACSG